MNRKVGRPKEESEVRSKLIQSARELFTSLSYEKVSTRMIAKQADVNVAMIRYYFGSKEGLFETMLRETVAPVTQQLQQFIKSGDQNSLTQIMQTYYRTMLATPQFPQLVAQLMNMPPSDSQRQLVEKVFGDISQPIQVLFFNRLSEKKIIRDDLDPKLSKVTFISLMIFPFLAPRSMLDIHEIELNEAFLTQLFEHNIQVLTHGLFDPEHS